MYTHWGNPHASLHRHVPPDNPDPNPYDLDPRMRRCYTKQDMDNIRNHSLFGGYPTTPWCPVLMNHLDRQKRFCREQAHQESLRQKRLAEDREAARIEQNRQDSIRIQEALFRIEYYNDDSQTVYHDAIDNQSWHEIHNIMSSKV